MLVAAVVIFGVAVYSMANGLILPGIVCLGGFSRKYGFICLGFTSIALWIGGHYVVGFLPLFLILWNIVGEWILKPRATQQNISQKEINNKEYDSYSINNMNNAEESPTKKLSAEIHFHKQDEASIYFESSCIDDEEIFGEVLLFSCFCMTTLIGMRDRSVVENLLILLSSMGNREDCLEFIDYTGKDGVEIVNYKGVPGRKQIDVKLDIGSDPIDFKTTPTGFDPVLATGIEYYFSHSLIILLKYLLKRRINDSHAFNSLTYAVSMCSMRYSADASSVRMNPIKEAWKIAEIAMKP